MDLPSYMSIRLIALDIDGTLIPPGAQHTALPDANLTNTIARLIEAGIEVVLATGRMYPGTASIAKHLGITHPLICQQGAATLKLDGQIIRQCAIDQEIAHELADYAMEEDWPYAWFDAKRYLVSAPNPASQHFADVSGIEFEIHDTPQHSGVIASGIDIISTSEHSTAIHRLLETRYGARVELLDFSSVTAVHSAEASKGKAVAQLAQDLGIDRSHVLAIGDSVNDASMLNWAGHSAAPEHCDAYARAAADEVVKGEGVEGVTALLKALLKSQEN
jgi:Cof subfamily protein (haloacid dehalogenase superfamily)